MKIYAKAKQFMTKSIGEDDCMRKIGTLIPTMLRRASFTKKAIRSRVHLIRLQNMSGRDAVAPGYYLAGVPRKVQFVCVLLAFPRVANSSEAGGCLEVAGPGHSSGIRLS